MYLPMPKYQLFEYDELTTASLLICNGIFCRKKIQISSNPSAALFCLSCARSRLRHFIMRDLRTYILEINLFVRILSNFVLPLVISGIGMYVGTRACLIPVPMYKIYTLLARLDFDLVDGFFSCSTRSHKPRNQLA